MRFPSSALTLLSTYDLTSHVHELSLTASRCPKKPSTPPSLSQPPSFSVSASTAFAVSPWSLPWCSAWATSTMRWLQAPECSASPTCTSSSKRQTQEPVRPSCPPLLFFLLLAPLSGCLHRPLVSSGPLPVTEVFLAGALCQRSATEPLSPCTQSCALPSFQ